MLLSISYIWQAETEALRGFETPCISVLLRLSGEMKRRSWFLCQGSQTQLFPCAVHGVYTSLECHKGCRMHSLRKPPRIHVFHLVSDTDHPFFAVWRLPALDSSLLSTGEGTSGAP